MTPPDLDPRLSGIIELINAAIEHCPAATARLLSRAAYTVLASLPLAPVPPAEPVAQDADGQPVFHADPPKMSIRKAQSNA